MVAGESLHSMQPTDIQRTFEAYPVLGSFSSELQARVLAEMWPIRASHGQLLFDVGDPCPALPLVAEGAIHVIRRLPTGRNLPLYSLRRGELCVLSVSCLLGDVLYPASAQAAGSVAGAALPKALFRTLVDHEPTFRHEMFGAFASRFCLLMGLIEEMCVTRLDERLAELLISRGPVIHATHQALADELGTAREVVSRILEHLEAGGFVRLRRARVDLISPENLARVYAPARLGH
jgi:CRP/FNR family transcriptional regulator